MVPVPVDVAPVDELDEPEPDPDPEFELPVVANLPKKAVPCHGTAGRGTKNLFD